MADQEKKISTTPEQLDHRDLEHTADMQHEVIREKLEQHQEHESEPSLESARHEALEQAGHHEHEMAHENARDTAPEHERIITKKDKEQSFTTTIREVQSQMSPGNRALSKVIHQPTVEKISDVVGNTVARPNAILTGALVAFLFTASFYLIARFNGYPLSGSETIASFILGWLVGLVIDYIRLLFTGKK